jgi:GntR family transcriptional repressor for pyruvate dehydrogenase complex
VEYSPIKRETVSEEVAQRLLTGILNGEFELGERLPSERELVSLFEVGRPTIREALRVLSVLGVLEVRSGEGAFVVRRHSDFIANAFRIALMLDRQAATDVIHVRMAIEIELAGLAAERATDEERLILAEVVARMADCLDDSAALTALDLDFHLGIAAAARNVSLSRLLDGTRALLKDWIERVLSEEGAAKRAWEQHRAIVEAITAKDPEAARASMRIHLTSVGAALMETVPAR